MRKNKATLLLLFSFIVNINCNTVQLSERITVYYNKDLNNEILRTLGQGRIHWQMKYLLDTIIHRHVRKTDKDTKYCIFEFSDFSYSGIAYFIDMDDTMYYRLTEVRGSKTGKEICTAKFKIGDSTYNIKYLIKEQKLSSSAIANNCDYKSFFLKNSCSIEELKVSDDGPSINTILKFRQNSNKNLLIEFYERYGAKYSTEQNKPNNSVANDKSKDLQKKIKFLN